jgi:hypothetical protein
MDLARDIAGEFTPNMCPTCSVPEAPLVFVDGERAYVHCLLLGASWRCVYMNVMRVFCVLKVPVL